MADIDNKFYDIKTPTEQKTYDFDFTDRLGTGESISSKTVSAIDLADNSDATATVINASTLTTPHIYVQSKAGTDGKRYQIKVSAVTSSSNTLEMYAIMAVYSTANTIAKIIRSTQRMLQDTALLLKLDEIEDFLLEALSYYSQDAPYIKVYDITGNGGYEYSLPSDWVEHSSLIESIEYPAGYQNPNMLDDDDWHIYKTASALKLRFYSYSPTASETVRVKYNLPYTFSTITNVPAQHQEALSKMVASLCCGALASYYFSMKDAQIAGDSVDYKTSGIYFAKQAKDFRADYNKVLGISSNDGEPGVKPASGTGNLSLGPPWVGNWMTHNRTIR